MRSHGAWASVPALLLVIAACSNDTKPRAGGETHWLLACVSDDDCGEENLTCVCGTCTRACSASHSCSMAGEPAAACYDTQSPLLLQRCEDRAGELTGGICLLDCDAGAECGTGRACDEGACVPAAGGAGSSAASGEAGSSAPSGEAGSSAPSGQGGSVSVDDFDDVSESVPWDMPIQSPPLREVIAGADARIAGTWLEVGCDPASQASQMTWGCVRLDVSVSASGEVTGTLQLVRAEGMLDPIPAVQDPTVGYPTLDAHSYFGLAQPQAGVPYRILDGQFQNDRFTFLWSPYDLWHEWCALQSPHRWTIGDHAFSFCVPQDREQWSTIDEGKIVLCTSADFEPLCSNDRGELFACVCDPFGPRCSPNYCQCDDARCDANVRFTGLHTELSLEGDVMTGAFSGGGERWSGSLWRVSP